MATLTFDKLAYVDRLKAAGVGEREARALAEGLDQALREEVATKSDLAAVKTDLAADIAAVKAELAADIAAVRTDLSAEIAAVRTDLSAEIAAVRTDLSAEIATVRTDLSAEIAAVRTDVAAVRTELVAGDHRLQVEIQTAKHDVLRWMVGMAFGQAGLTVALIRLLPH
jgi:predicted amino acid-binding ACT domain protein